MGLIFFNTKYTPLSKIFIFYNILLLPLIFMKSDLYKKILRLSIVEILLQLGFEKCSEESLNIFTEILEYYIEKITDIIYKFREHSTTYDIDTLNEINIITLILDNAYANHQYNYNELLQFMSQQINMVSNITTDTNGKSMLNLLKFLPKNQSLHRLYKVNKSKPIGDNNEIKESGVVGEVELDCFLKNFIKNCEIKYKNTKEIVGHDYYYNLGKSTTTENCEFEQVETILNTKEDEEQKSFFNDLISAKKIVVKKNFCKNI